ncbi:MAG: metallophosphoesterase [Chitinivibrionales bacterium]|nr:metallophosphoesterase [Chitinivibrionales bacterium]
MKRMNGARAATKYSLIATGGFVLLALAWGILVEPRWLDEKHITGNIPRLPASWEGKKVGLMADLQVGMWLDNLSTIEESVARLCRMKPAFVIIAGDFVYHPTEEERAEAIRELEPDIASEVQRQVGTVIRLLAPLNTSRIPTYAVLGNHDYAMENERALKLPGVAAVVRRALNRTGIVVLENEAVVLRHPEGGSEPPLYLVGIGPAYPDRANISRAFRGVPAQAARIVVCHNPITFARIPAGKAPLAVAGHTHGGQIRIPFTADWTWMNLIGEQSYHADGWVEQSYGHANNTLYVNRGIGFSVAPIRINARPELTIISLTNGNNDTR